MHQQFYLAMLFATTGTVFTGADAEHGAADT